MTIPVRPDAKILPRRVKGVPTGVPRPQVGMVSDLPGPPRPGLRKGAQGREDRPREVQDIARGVQAGPAFPQLPNFSTEDSSTGMHNRHEKRHGLARKVFHGQRGEVRKRYREGQEDQLGALGLVVNAVCLFNSLYLDEAVRRLRADGETVADGDLARVSPLAREHVRVLGRYHFALNESVAGGGLRPLRDPSEPDEHEFPPPGLD